jgi:hypothetical protein
MTDKSVASELRHRIYLAAGGRCAACRKRIALEEMHCDHILPVATGGRDDLDNLRCLCVNCHKLRHGGRGYAKYERWLGCGCGLSVWHRDAQADAPHVLRYLKIEPPRRTRLPILLFRCPTHRRMRWSAWLGLLGNPLPRGIPAGSRAQLRKFIRSANDPSRAR